MFQNRIFLGRCSHIVCPDHRADWSIFFNDDFINITEGVFWILTYGFFFLTGFAGSFLGRRSVTGWNSVFACGHSIRSDVRPDGTCARLYDRCVRCDVQRKHCASRTHDIAARYVRDVLWFRDFGHLWAGTKCHSVGAGLFLSDVAAVGRHLAYWRNAGCSSVSLKKIFVPKINTNSLLYFADTFRTSCHWRKQRPHCDACWPEAGVWTSPKCTWASLRRSHGSCCSWWSQWWCSGSSEVKS